MVVTIAPILRGASGTPGVAVDGGLPVFLEGAEGPRIDVWVDYHCPYCRIFDAANGAQIDELVAAGRATLVVHPIAILDRVSLGTRYSTRAANASACVAQEARTAFPAFHRLLFAVQPEEGTEGLTDEELIALAKQAGADSEGAASCIVDHRYAAWVSVMTDAAVEDPALARPGGRFGTPTVLVDGVRYDGPIDDPRPFARFLQDIAGVVDTQQT
jgi:protein-disulfide isomerase